MPYKVSEMKKKLLAVFFILSQLYLLSQTVYENSMDGRVYVKFTKASLKSLLEENPNNLPLKKFDQLSSIFLKYGVTKVCRPFYQASDDEKLPFILRLEFTQIDKVDDLIKELTIQENIEYAERVSFNKIDATPNDALFATINGSTHLNQINAQNAWNVFNGNSNITVAIVDNAVMWNHIDLASNTYTNAAEIAGNNLDDDGNGYIDDVNGWDVADGDNNPIPSNLNMNHGTHCAGIAGAVSNNGIGVASIGWNIKLIPVKCQPNLGLTFGVSYGYEGIIYAVKAKARIISCSWGSSLYSDAEQSIINYAWNKGCIVIASAGNNGNNAFNYPGAYNNVYAVAAVDPSDVKSSISSFGTWVDICAPGNNILSTYPYSSIPDYQPSSGTSMSTPLVAGLAALMLSKSPHMTKTDVLNCISSTAVNIYTIAGNSAFGSGSQLGAGRIEAFAAMNCAATYSAVPPIANFYAFPLKICPSSTVSFKDSSLYSPTSFTWTFQGGTPATSNAQNPIVSYSSPGIYSVSLAVSNTNGTNTKVKLGYISVANPINLPFIEGFENPLFLPNNWSENNIQNDAMFWERTNTVGGFGTSTACVKFDNYNHNVVGERDEMRSPKFDFSNVASARLRFDVAYARYDAFGSDTLEVKLSTNCGASWNSIYLKGGTQLATAPDNTASFSPSPAQWRRDTIDISTLVAGQNNVMFSFINRGRFGQIIYLDNINIALPQFTLGATVPAQVCENSFVSIANTTTGSATYSWTFSGGNPAVSNLSNPIVTYSASGIYTIQMQASNGGSVSVINKTISVQPTLSITINGTTSICEGETATLSASGASTYTWIGLGTTNPINVNPATSTIYTVTGSNGGCNDTKTISLTVIPVPALSVNSIPSFTVCSGESIQLNAAGNFSTYSWAPGANTLSTQHVTLQTNQTYSLSATSASGCVANLLVSLVANPLPISVISSSASGCGSVCLGMINATSSMGTAPYTYSLTNSNCTVLPCSNLCAGNYSLTTTDAMGCKNTNSILINSTFNNVSAVINATAASCATCSDGIIEAIIAGASGNLTYSWAPNVGNSQMLQNILPGCYTLTATDALNCSVTSSACVSFVAGIEHNSNQLNNVQLFPNPVKDKLFIEGLYSMSDIKIINSIGQVVLTMQAINTKATLNLNELSSGLYLIEIHTGNDMIIKKILLDK